MQNTNKLVVGEPLPHFPETLNGKCAGTLEVRDADWIEFNAFLPDISHREVKSFESEPIRVKYYGNSSNGKNVVYFNTGVGLFENFFNPNLYTDDRMKKFFDSENITLFMLLVDSKSQKVKAIRHVALNRRLADRLKDLWQNSMTTGISDQQYRQWVDSEIMPVNPALHFSVGKELGVIRGGLLTQQAVFLGN